MSENLNISNYQTGLNEKASASLPMVGSLFSGILPAILFAGSWFILFVPAYLYFLDGAWALDQNAHIPFILAICIGLSYAQLSKGEWPITQKWLDRVIGLAILFISCASFVYARVQEVDLVLSATQIFVAFGAALSLFGWSGVRKLWFIFALSLYLILWPSWLIDMMTFPLKMMISNHVANFLFALGLPVTQEGAIINAGAYQLLVADACSGVNSLIALTSVGVVYLYVIKRPCFASNLVTVLALIPVAILANMMRVTVLVLITYFMGYDAGQSFLHELSGLVMFVVALFGVFAIEAMAAAFFMGANFKGGGKIVQNEQGASL